MSLINTAVWIGVDADETDPQPIATECPTCFAVVRKARLDQHNQAIHQVSVSYKAVGE